MEEEEEWEEEEEKEEKEERRRLLKSTLKFSGWLCGEDNGKSAARAV